MTSPDVVLGMFVAGVDLLPNLFVNLLTCYVVVVIVVGLLASRGYWRWRETWHWRCGCWLPWRPFARPRVLRCLIGVEGPSKVGLGRSMPFGLTRSLC